MACSMTGGPNGRFVVLVGMWNLGRLGGKGDICKELRKRMIDMCCFQEVKWRGAIMLGMKERRYKLWWSGK